MEETTLQGIVDLENAICPVMGDEVMEGQYVDWQGYRVHFCCAGCDRTFLEDPEYYMGILAEDPSVSVDLPDYCVTGDSSFQENSISDQCSVTDDECSDSMTTENDMCETCGDDEEAGRSSRENCCTVGETTACHAG
jgi:hypothetical protein